MAVSCGSSITQTGTRQCLPARASPHAHTASRRLSLRSRTQLAAHQTATQGAQQCDSNAAPTYERVLRYPDGNVRRIRYPLNEAPVECSGSKCYDVLTSWEFDDETYCSTYDDPSSLEVLPSQSTVIQPEPSSSERRQSLAETAEMLDSLFAASFSQTKSPETAQQVSSSYEVCPGCPWLLPRPVFVLALGADVADLGNTYTLPARLQQEGTANELAKVMRNRKFESIMDISRLVDGVVTFEHHDDAARFGAMLEEEGHSSVMIAEVDSHKLFRMAGDLQHVVVLMRAGGYLPMPYQLAAALKQQPALDEM